MSKESADNISYYCDCPEKNNRDRINTTILGSDSFLHALSLTLEAGFDCSGHSGPSTERERTYLGANPLTWHLENGKVTGLANSLTPVSLVLTYISLLPTFIRFVVFPDTKTKRNTAYGLSTPAHSYPGSRRHALHDPPVIGSSGRCCLPGVLARLPCW